jgi:hypothetical protein
VAQKYGMSPDKGHMISPIFACLGGGRPLIHPSPAISTRHEVLIASAGRSEASIGILGQTASRTDLSVRSNKHHDFPNIK